jgi:hypothetical protein
MIQTVNFLMFVDAFYAHDRYDQLGGYKGLRCLFDYLEELEEGGQPVELDVIALCCDWRQYDSVQAAYDEMIGKGEQDEDVMLYQLENKTTVLVYDGGVLVAQF